MGGLALVILVLMGFGVMFRVIRPGKVVWFQVLVAILPVFIGTVIQGFNTVFSSHGSWFVWVAGILAILIAIRLGTNRFIRRR